MRAVTSAVARDEPINRDTATCASCRRQTLTLSWGSANKCSLCSEHLDPVGDVVVNGTEQLHVKCWRRLASADRKRLAER